MGISFLFSFFLASLLFTAICKASSDNYFALVHLFFLGMGLITASCTMLQPLYVVLQVLCLSDLISWIYFSLPLFKHKTFDLVLLQEVAFNSTIELPSRRPTNWRTVIQRKFSHCCKSSRAYNRFSNLGFWWRDWEPPGNLTWKVSRISLQNFHRTKITDSWRAQENLMCTRTEEKGAVTPEETELDFPVSVQESLAEVWVDSGLPQGQGHWLQQSWELGHAGISPYNSMNSSILISGSSAFSESSLYIWKFAIQVLLKPSLKDFEHYLASM